jgi:methionyl-tRNA formyltransferase
LTKLDGAIDWSQSANQVHNLIRGLHPWPHAFTFANGKRLILLRSAIPDSSSSSVAGAEHLIPGTIVAAAGDDLRVACRDRTLSILNVQAEGSRPMTVREFLAGHHLAPGGRFTSAP